jgi:hypothetical protein
MTDQATDEGQLGLGQPTITNRTTRRPTTQPQTRKTRQPSSPVCHLLGQRRARLLCAARRHAQPRLLRPLFVDARGALGGLAGAGLGRRHSGWIERGKPWIRGTTRAQATLALLCCPMRQHACMAVVEGAAQTSLTGNLATTPQSPCPGHPAPSTHHPPPHRSPTFEPDSVLTRLPALTVSLAPSLTYFLERLSQ